MGTPLGDLFVRAPPGNGAGPALRSKRAFPAGGTNVNPAPPSKCRKEKVTKSHSSAQPFPAISFVKHTPPLHS